MTAGVRGDDSVELVDSVERGKLVDEDIADFVLMLAENGEVVAIFVIVSDEDGGKYVVVEGILDEMEVMGKLAVLVGTVAVAVVNVIVVTNGVTEEVDVIGTVVDDFDAVRIVVAIVTGCVVTCGVLVTDELVEVIAEVITLDLSVVGECCCDVVDTDFCVVFTEDDVVDSEDEYTLLDCISVEVCSVPEVPVLLKSVVLSFVDDVS